MTILDLIIRFAIGVAIFYAVYFVAGLINIEIKQRRMKHMYTTGKWTKQQCKEFMGVKDGKYSMKITNKETK